MTWRGWFVGVVTLAGCAHQPLHPAMYLSPDAMFADSLANQLIISAFTADEHDSTPDGVYAPQAQVIANGEVRAAPPRFAGVEGDGMLQLGSSDVAVTGDFVWGTFEYRWIPSAPGGLAVAGRATIIIGRDPRGEWRILHVHSSTVPVSPAPDTTRPAPPDTIEPAGRRGVPRVQGVDEEELPRIVSRMRLATPGAKIRSRV